MSFTPITSEGPKKEYNILPNLLNQFVSYNSLITLYVSTPATHTRMVETEQFNESEWEMICQSGGLQSGGFFSNYNLFLDNFTMETIVGQSQSNRGSNAAEISFDIIEPNGMDLIEALYDYSNNVIQEHNYCQLPYLIKLTFKGYLQDGSSVIIPGTTKYIPIALANMSIKMNSAGSTYKVTCVPINELATYESAGRIPAMCEILGTGNVQSYFTSLSDSLNGDQLWYVKQGIYSVADTYNIVCKKQTTEVGEIDPGATWFINPLYDGLSAAPKDTSTDTPTNKTGAVDSVIKAKEVLKYLSNNNPIAFSTDSQGHATAETQVGTLTVINTDRTSTLDGGLNYSTLVSHARSIIRVNAGSSIVDTINSIMINSHYIIDQITEFQKAMDEVIYSKNIGSTKNHQNFSNAIREKTNKDLATLNKPLKWFNVTTTVTLGAYDEKRGKYSASYTYTITPYLIDNAMLFEVPHQIPSKRVIKEYNYMLTGKNTEIMDFNIDFNTAFLTYTSRGNSEKKSQGTGATSGTNDQNALITQNLLVNNTNPINSGWHRSASPVNVQNPTATNEQTPEKSSAVDLASTIYAPAELLSLNLSVIGDPDFIRQDGIFLAPSNNPPGNGYSLEGSGKPASILYNLGEIYSTVNFITPHDLDQSTGLLTPIENTHRSVFSGLYRIATVTNKITHGVFTQELHMIRYVDQDRIVSQNKPSPQTAISSPEPNIKPFLSK